MDTCIEQNCPITTIYARKLCRNHYGQHRYHGTLDQISGPLPVKHSLTNIDGTTLTATCAICGDGVSIYAHGTRPNGETRWRCLVKGRELWNKPNLDARISFLESQGGLCAICGRSESLEQALALDHCHKTGRLRGLLCMQCNTGLGMFRDNPETLQAAIDYLNR